METSLSERPAEISGLVASVIIACNATPFKLIFDRESPRTRTH